MKRLRWPVLASVSIILAISSPVWAQKIPFSNAEIDVQVRNADGSPAPQGTLVVLEFEEGGAIDNCQASPGGHCRFIPPGPGVYVVRLRQPGYKEASARIDLVDTERGYASLVLTRLPGQAPPNPPKDARGSMVSLLDLAVPDNARKEFQKGEDALKKNNLDSGISHLKKAIRLHGSFPQAYAMLGMAYVQQNDFEAGQAALQKAIQLDPKSAAAYIGLGAMYNRKRNYPEAEKMLRRGLELSPDAAGGQYELALTYWALGRWQDAEPHARKAVELRPALAPAHVLLGNIMLRKRDAPEALREFKEYLRLDPKGPMAGPVRDMVAKIQKALQTK
jgi:tetratricopeptide (TPR) repeat protein